MKFIELHESAEETFMVNTAAIVSITTVEYNPDYKSLIRFVNFARFCTETVKEILQKIAEAEQRERSFMDDWQDRVDDQLSRLAGRKDGSAE